MESNPPTNDPKSIWQSQPTEAPGVTLVLIRQKAQALHRKARRELFRNALGHLFIVAFCGAGAALSRGTGQRAAFAVALAWGLAGGWVSQRGMWTPPMPGDAAFETGLEFYRQEIQRRRLLFRRWMAWSFAPVALALGALVAPPVRAVLEKDPRLLRKAIPFFTVLAIWFIAVWFMRRRGKQDVQREMDELEEIQKESNR